MPGSWVTRTIVWPCSSFSVRSRDITCSAMTVSRFPVGSSAQTIAGFATRARAIVTRCCSPPDIWFGSWLPRWASPTWSSMSRAATRACRGGLPTRRRGSSTFSTAEKTGIRLNDWNTNPIDRARCSVRSASLMAKRSRPATVTRPLEMSSSPERQFSSVVFPDPDGPMTATNSPAATERSRSTSAGTETSPDR